MCSAFSLGIGAELLLAGQVDRGIVGAGLESPAMGRNCARPPFNFTSASGDEPTTVTSPRAQVITCKAMG